MADFDPDAYLAKKPEEGAFDPDAYLGLKPRQSTITGEAIRGGKQLLSSMQSGLGSIVAPEEAAIAGVKRGEKIAEEAGQGPSFEPVKKAYEERGILSALGEVGSQIPRALAGQGANMAAMAGGARMGAMAGTAAAPFLGPFAPAGPVVGGIVGAGAALLPQFMGSNVERIASEQMAQGKPVDVNRAKAYSAAAGQALLEGAENYFVLGKGLVKGVLGLKTVGKEAESELLKAAQRSVTGTVARGVAKGAAIELPVEVGQQILERAQAGLDLTSPDALKEYGDTLYQTALVAGPMGAAGKVFERAHAKEQLAKQAAPVTPPPPATPTAAPAAQPAPVTAAPNADYATVFEQKVELEQAPQTAETTARIAELDKRLEELSTEAEAPVEETPAAPTEATPAPTTQGAHTQPITAEEVTAIGASMSKKNRQWLVDNVQGKTPLEVQSMVQADPTLLTFNKGIANALNEITQIVELENRNANPQVSDVQPANGAGGRERGMDIPVQPVDANQPTERPAPTTGAPAEPVGQRLVSPQQPAGTGDVQQRQKFGALADLPPLPIHPDELAKQTREPQAAPVAPAVEPQVAPAAVVAPVVSLKDGSKISIGSAPAPEAFSNLVRMQYGEPISLIANNEAGEAVGRLTYMPKGGPIDVKVTPAARRKGIGTALYDALEAAGGKLPTLESGVAISDEARAVRESRKQKPIPAPVVDPAEIARQQEADAVAARLAEQQAASAKAKTAPEQRKVVAERGAREQVGAMPSIAQIKGALQELTKSNKASPKLKAEAQGHLDDLSAKKPDATPEETDLLHELAFNFLTAVAGGKRGLYQSPRKGGPSSLKPGDVQTLVDQMTEAWENMPAVTVHATEATLPQKIIDQAAKDGMTGRITGVFDPDDKHVHLVEENLKTPQDVQNAIVHEVAGHFGLRTVLGDKYNKVMDALFKGNPLVQSLAKEKMGGKYPLDQRTAVEEVLAEMAETLPEAPAARGALRRVFDAIKGFFQSVFGTRQVSDDAVRQIVANARIYVKKGGKAGSGENLAGKGAALYQAPKNALTDILTRMGRELPKPDTRSYTAQATEALKGAADLVKTKDGKGPIQRVMDAAANMLDAGEPLMRGIRKEIRETLPENEANAAITALSMSQASHDSGLATTAILDGGIGYDKDTSKFKTEESKYSLKTLGAAYKKLMAAHNYTLPEARVAASAALESKRMLALFKMQDRLIAQADQLEADGKKKPAKLLRDKAEGYTFHMTREQAEIGMELYAASPEIQEIDDIKQGMRQWLRTFLQDTGVWSPETAQWMLDNAEWVPFQREATEEETDKVGFTEYIRGLQAKAKEYQFKGSLRAVHDVMDNFENWAAYSVSRGIKNQKATELAQAAVKYLPETEATAVVHFNPKNSDRTVSYLEKGSPKYVEFDSVAKAQLFKGAPLMAKSGLPIIGGMIDSMNSVFRGAIVNFPLFPVYQLAMDSISATYLSGLKPRYAFQIPLKAVSEAVKTLRGTSETYKELRKFGAVGVHDYNATLSRTNADVEAGLKSLGNWGKYKSVMHNINLASDNAVRQAVYLAAKDSGLSEAAAVEKAFEIINFRTRVGNQQLAAAARNVVFLNSFYAASRVALKVLSSEGISPTERKQARNTLISNLAWIAGASTLLAMANTGDDEYEKMSRQEQAGKLTMPGLHGWGIPLRPDVFMLVKLLAETTVRQFSDKYADDPAKLRATLSDGVVNAMFSGPLPVSQPIKVAIELGTNHDFFTGRAIVGSGLEKREGAAQFSAGTSELAKGIGQGTKNLAEAIGLENYFKGASPVKVDHFIQGMMGMYGGAVIMITNNLVNERPSQSLQDTIASLPGMGRVGVKEFDNQTKTDFYDLASKVSEAVATANSMKMPGQSAEYREYREKHLHLLKYQSYVQNIERALGQMRAQITMVTANKALSANEKEDRIHEIKVREQRMLANQADFIKKARTEALNTPARP